MKRVAFTTILVISGLLMTGRGVLSQEEQAPSFMTGIQGGPLLFFGDIGSMGVGYSLGFTASYEIKKDISLNLSVDYGSVSDSDEGTPNSARDYAFSTTLVEPCLSVMYTFFTIEGYGKTKEGKIKKWDKWSGLVYGGVALPWTRITPERHLTGDDQFHEKGIAPAISAGAALQYGFNNQWFIRLTFNPHLIFSDYLDGYTSPQPSANDIYHRVTLGLFYQLDE